ncbi:hypothetical protein DER45DRAFT_642719 [Fusarium avenaceum]|nr:hypothetical protein DER45DRAFT_642719 [Fusarium avenaceum]
MAKRRHKRTATKPKIDNHPKKDIKMPKNRRQRGNKANNNNKDAQKQTEPVKPAPGDCITKYGSKEARRALEERGYHPLVTNKDMEVIKLEMLDKCDEAISKPTRDQFMAGMLPRFRGIYANTNMLITDTESKSSLTENETSEPISSRLRLFDGRQPPGQLLGELFASQGIKRLQLFAVADPKGFNAMSQGISIWDFATSGFHGKPCGHVFLCLTPHRSQNTFEQSPAISELERKSRAQVCRLIASVRSNCGPTEPYWVHENWRDEEELQTEAKDDIPEVKCESAKWGRTLVRMIQSLPDTNHLWRDVEKAVDPLPHMHYYMSKQVAAKCIFDLLRSIFARTSLLRVLHFHRTPLLDRRLIAIILRACPYVTAIGIYECPLIHFGDIICLLDLIHEVNLERDKQGLPRVESFDFYPRYHAGMPYIGRDVDENCTYGLLWKHQNNNVVQRGVLAILLHVVLKSRRMGLGLLMDHDAAFMAYLSNVPLLPRIVLDFLDGLYRYLDVQKADPDNCNALKQALYDMSKAIRISLEPLDKDWPNYYMKQMGIGLVFCSSCGYELLPEFYIGEELRQQPHQRTCCACYLQFWMDREKDHQKIPSRDLMSVFYPDWEPKAFNVDAPLLREGRELLRMGTRKSIRDPEPSIQILPDGEQYVPSFTIEFVRDNKDYENSLQGLPDLKTLLLEKGLREQEMSTIALCADTDRTVALLLRAEYPEREGSRLAFAKTRKDGAAPDHYDEGQGLAPNRNKMLNGGIQITYGWYQATRDGVEMNQAGH